MCDMGDSGLVHIARSVSEIQFLHSLMGTQEKGKVITESKYYFAAADARTEVPSLQIDLLRGSVPPGQSCKLQLDLYIFQQLNLAT